MPDDSQICHKKSTSVARVPLCILNTVKLVYENFTRPHFHLPRSFGQLRNIFEEEFDAKVTYERRISNRTSLCSHIESTAAPVGVVDMMNDKDAGVI